jgi:hypothetical protein
MTYAKRQTRKNIDEGETFMKYILMMNTMKAGHGVPQWNQKDLQAHIAFMMGLNKELRQSGELVSAEGLSFPDQAKLVRAGKDGTPITDGVFPESKDRRRRFPGACLHYRGQSVGGSGPRRRSAEHAD